MPRSEDEAENKIYVRCLLTSSLTLFLLTFTDVHRLTRMWACTV